MKKELLTREVLDRNNVWVEYKDNQPIIHQDKSKLNRHQEIRNQYKCTTKHKYGKDSTYLVVSLVLDDNIQRTYTVQDIVWVYFKSAIPKGYHIDHIDNNKFNNSLDNLQMITVKENLAKRGGTVLNQYDHINLEKFGNIYLELRDQWRKERQNSERFAGWYLRQK